MPPLYFSYAAIPISIHLYIPYPVSKIEAKAVLVYGSFPAPTWSDNQLNFNSLVPQCLQHLRVAHSIYPYVKGLNVGDSQNNLSQAWISCKNVHQRLKPSPFFLIPFIFFQTLSLPRTSTWKPFWWLRLLDDPRHFSSFPIVLFYPSYTSKRRDGLPPYAPPPKLYSTQPETWFDSGSERDRT